MSQSAHRMVHHPLRHHHPPPHHRHPPHLHLTPPPSLCMIQSLIRILTSLILNSINSARLSPYSFHRFIVSQMVIGGCVDHPMRRSNHHCAMPSCVSIYDRSCC